MKTIKDNLMPVLLFALLVTAAVLILSANSKLTAAASCLLCTQDVYDEFCWTTKYDGKGKCPGATYKAKVWADSCADIKCKTGGSQVQEYMCAQSEYQNPMSMCMSGQLDYLDCRATQLPDLECTRALCQSNTIPTTAFIGETRSVSVTMSNPSWAKPWSGSEGYKLGSQNPANNMVWNKNRSDIPAGTVVAGGSSYTFNFDITAPSTAGTYDSTPPQQATSQWQMLQEGVTWFGDICGPSSITVKGLPAPSPGTLSASCPLPGSTATLSWTANPDASWYNIRVDNTQNGWNDNCTNPNPGDYCIDGVTASSRSFTSIPGASYAWWMHGCAASGACSDPVSGPGFTCTPPPPPPPPPTFPSPAAFCPAPGSSATVSWNVSIGATYYALRVNNTIDGWDESCSSPGGDFCSRETTTSKTFISRPGASYSWWVHACNSSGCSASTNGPSFTCTPPPPPPVRLDSLTISSGLTPSITGGAAKTLGRTAEEGGSNWYNPLNISLSATGGIGSTTQYYVAFYDKKEGTGTVKTAYSSLDPVKQLLKNDPSAGFILGYDAGTRKYYVWDWSATSGSGCIGPKGCFVDITTIDLLQGYLIYNSSGVLLYRAYPKPELTAPTWQVKIMAAFGSKNMYTPGYVVNSGSSPVNSDFQADMSPVVISPPVTALPSSQTVAVIPAVKQLISSYFRQLLALL